MPEAESVEVLLAGFGDTERSIAVRARALILELFPSAVEMPDPSARLIGYGTDRTHKGLVCGIVLQRGYVNLMFAAGAELQDAVGLLEGTGKRARHVKLRSPADVETPALRGLLRQAVDVHLARRRG